MDGDEAARRMVGSCTGKPLIMNPIMMRFRPIAPKPVVGGSVSGGASSVESKNSPISKGRTKRKYVRVRRYNRKKKTTSTTASTTDDHAAVTTTLQLLPERQVEFVGGGGGRSEWWENNNNNNERGENDVVLISDPSNRGAAVELSVTVECVTEACMEDQDLDQEIEYCTDEERIKKLLDEDTCPGFVSDGMNRVEWLNKAFKRMVRQRNSEYCESPAGEGKVRVWLIWKPKLSTLKRVFTSQIKLQFKNNNSSKIVPCDAWRLNGGGFAWKLDVKAALTLAPLLQEDF